MMFDVCLSLLLGPDIIKRVRGDLSRTFGDPFLNYVYHCNAQKPT